jgi:hypothetical protein
VSKAVKKEQHLLVLNLAPQHTLVVINSFIFIRLTFPKVGVYNLG